MKSGAFKIAILYTLAGILWITLSDRILFAMQKHVDLDFVLFLSNIKGICYVVITGLMLYQLISLHTRRLAQSEQQYRSYFEDNPIPMWIVNKRTMLYLAANNAAITNYGYTGDEFLKMSTLDIRPPEDIKAAISAFRAIVPGVNDIGTWQHIKKDGTVISVHVTLQVPTSGNAEQVLVIASELK